MQFARHEVQIRETRKDDASSVVAWFATHAEAVRWGGPDVPTNFDANWFSHELDDPRTVHRTAYTSYEPIIGVYGLRSFLQEQRIHIRRLAVAPRFRGKGVGHILVTDAISIALAQKAITVSLNVYGSNAHALQVYELLGFRALRKRDAPEDASGVSVYMERSALL